MQARAIIEAACNVAKEGIEVDKDVKEATKWFKKRHGSNTGKTWAGSRDKGIDESKGQGVLG